MLMRGGTSKGAFFLAEDLPAEPDDRDALLLRIMGSPDIRQIDGVGGATPLTSKVAVVAPSDRPDADIDYLFLQVSVDQQERIAGSIPGARFAVIEDAGHMVTLERPVAVSALLGVWLTNLTDC